MSGRHRAQKAYGQRIQKLYPDCYRLHWTVDKYYANSRLRHPTGYSRDTDEAGARRFAKRWNVQMPEDKETAKQPEN